METNPVGAASVYGRKRKGWDQSDLARALADETGKTKWTKQRVSRVENGGYEPRYGEVLSLAKVLDLPIEFVLYGTDSVGRTDPGLLDELTLTPESAPAALKVC